MAPIGIFLLGLLIVFIVSALPLYLAVNILGGKTSIFKTLLVMFLSGIIVTTIQSIGGIFGGMFAFIVMIWFYRVAFELEWIAAFFVWLLQLAFVSIFYALGVLMFGAILTTSILF